MSEFYLVGGAVRDQLLNRPYKDLDYTVVGFDTYRGLVNHLIDEGYNVVHEYEDKYTVRAQSPEGDWNDYVWARRDAEYVDGVLYRVEAGSLYDDLARRDFTVNAMARNCDSGELIDLFQGQYDLERRVIRSVGDPVERFLEDPRRLTRAIRFSVQLGFSIAGETKDAFFNKNVLELFGKPKFTDKIKEELNKALRIDTYATLQLLHQLPMLLEIITDVHDIFFITSNKER
jgi:tRNA nucleotidyltransferase (CCA-adding enzyme)